jgi:hypothetical protein
MSSTFEDQLKNPGCPLAVSASASRTALLAFGGIVGALGIPPFEFFNVTRDFPLTRVYVRDPDQAWYHRGLRGLTLNVRSTAHALGALLKERSAERTVLVGNSMGGYAALAIGALMDATEVHAFSPQTFIDSANRARHGDDRWASLIARTLARGDPSLYDLLPLLEGYRGRCRFVLHYGATHALDRIHAERLSSCASVTLRPHPASGHNIVRVLRDSGELARIISGASTAPAQP